MLCILAREHFGVEAGCEVQRSLHQCQGDACTDGVLGGTTAGRCLGLRMLKLLPRAGAAEELH